MNIITREDLKWILVCEIYGSDNPLVPYELKAIDKLLDDFFDTTKERFGDLKDNELKAIRKLYGVFDNGVCQSKKSVAEDLGVSITSISRYIENAKRQFRKYVKYYEYGYKKIEKLRDIKNELKDHNLTNITLESMALPIIAIEYFEKINVKSLEDILNLDVESVISLFDEFDILSYLLFSLPSEIKINPKIEHLDFGDGQIKILKAHRIDTLSQFASFSDNIDDYRKILYTKNFLKLESLIAKAKRLGIYFKIGDNLECNKDNVSLITSIEELDFCVRTCNVLRRANIRTVGDIINLDEEQIIRIRNMGSSSKEEIIDKIHSLGLLMSWETPVVEKENESLQENNIKVDKIANNNVEEKNETPIEKYKRLLNEKAMLQQKLLELDTELAELLFSVRDNEMERVDNNGTTRR